MSASSKLPVDHASQPGLSDLSGNALDSSLPTVPGGWATSEVQVGDRQIQLLLPANPDAFLDDPQVQQANSESDYMPYWTYLWPAARHMAKLVLDEPWRPGTPTLELGSGIGLVGIAALATGLRVTFSDYDRTSLLAAEQNALRNDLKADAAVLLDWRTPEASSLQGRFKLILGCDVIYEVALHEHLLNVLDRHLEDDGVCWLGDPGRSAFNAFRERATRRGYSIDLHDEHGRSCEFEASTPAAFRLAVLHRQESQERQVGK